MYNFIAKPNNKLSAFFADSQPTSDTQDSILRDIQARLARIEDHLETRPSLIITGNAVTQEWEKLTGEHYVRRSDRSR